MPGEKRTEQFGQPLMRIMGDPSISRPARLAYCILTGATDSKTAECRMSITSLAGKLGIERKNASRYIKELEDRGVIIRLSRNTQAAKWRVLVGGVFSEHLPRQWDKLNGNLSHQRRKNLSRQRDTFIDTHKKIFSEGSHFPASPGNDKGFDFDSKPHSRVITDQQEKVLIAKQEELEAKRAKLGIKSKAGV